MRVLRSLAAGLVCLTLLAQEDSLPDQIFRATVNVVVAPTTVMDKKGDYVSGLQPRDFRLFDNEKEQDIQVDVSFVPISLVIAVQASANMEGQIPKIRKIGSMLQPIVFGEQGEAAVISYDHRIKTIQDFTSNPDHLTEAMGKIKPGGMMYRLDDAVQHASRMLRNRPQNRRRILLVIGETRDRGSESRKREVLTELQLHNILFYSINVPHLLAEATSRPAPPRPNPIPAGAHHLPGGAVVTPDTVSAQRNMGNWVPAFEEIFKGVKGIFFANSMELFAKYTGGKEYAFNSQASLEDAVWKVGNELHSQYLISYNPNNKLEGGFHKIHVEVNRPDLDVRTRLGYWMAAVQ